MQRQGFVLSTGHSTTDIMAIVTTTSTTLTSMAKNVPSTISSHRGGLPTPPLDDDELQLHTIDDMLVERARTIPDAPLVGYPKSPKSASSYVYYTAKDLDRFANGAAQDFVRQGLCQVSMIAAARKCKLLTARLAICHQD